MATSRQQTRLNIYGNRGSCHGPGTPCFVGRPTPTTAINRLRALPGIEVCGKTGSVQVVAQKEAKKGHLLPMELRDHGWFASFAPRDDPKVVAVVFVEHGEHGASAAAPLAARLAEYWVTKSRGGTPEVLADLAARPVGRAAARAN